MILFRSSLLDGVAAIAFAFLAVANSQAGLIAYYPFDSDTATDWGDLFVDGNTGSGTGYHWMTEDGSSGAAVVLDNGLSMFGGGAAKWPTAGSNSSNHSLINADPELGQSSFANFTGSIWAYANPGSNSNGWNGGGSDRFLFGTRSNTNNSGWALFENKDVPNDIRLLNGGSGPTTGAVSSINNTLGAATNGVFHHIAMTFSGGLAKIYIDGIKAVEGGTGDSNLQDSTVNNFSIGNEGDRRNSSSARSWSGNLDDAVFRDDALNDAQIAIMHGLGRFAGVSYQDGVGYYDYTPRTVDLVYDAYTSQDSANAGGKTWYYNPNVGGGTEIGRIGGSFADGSAYIVLGADGSGMTLVPEPSTIAMLVLAGFGLIAYRYRRA